MNQANAILGLLTQTSLHAGAGSSVGIIDLPIQREGHNGWPCVFGSAVKGALRTRAEDAGEAFGKDNVLAVFGPDTDNASAHAGALAVGDARLLLLPVRSLTSQFKWVTCPDALKRLQRDAGRLGIDGLRDFEVAEVRDTPEECVAQVAGQAGSLYLEEYRFKTRQANLGKIIAALKLLMRRDDAVTALEAQLVIVSDSMFTALAQNAPPVNAHIALDSNTKTAKRGALWYEETLPPETLLYCAVSASPSRRKETTLDAAAVRDLATERLFAHHQWLQLGGNETVGMGWCAVQAIRAGG